MNTDGAVQKKMAQQALVPKAPGPNKLFAQETVVHGDWRDDLVRDGYVVIKGAIPRDRADQYADAFMSMLENL
jgi:hypothetical protein